MSSTMSLANNQPKRRYQINLTARGNVAVLESAISLAMLDAVAEELDYKKNNISALGAEMKYEDYKDAKRNFNCYIASEAAIFADAVSSKDQLHKLSTLRGAGPVVAAVVAGINAVSAKQAVFAHEVLKAYEQHLRSFEKEKMKRARSLIGTKVTQEWFDAALAKYEARIAGDVATAAALPASQLIDTYKKHLPAG
jgi:hypothetical protein